jgi:hypothetical protein
MKYYFGEYYLDTESSGLKRDEVHVEFEPHVFRGTGRPMFPFD